MASPYKVYTSRTGTGPLAKGPNPLSARGVEPIDRRNLTVPGSHRVTGPHLAVSDHDVMVIVTQAFGPRGDNLVGISDVAFDGHPAVTLKVRANGTEGLVHLSPIHGDARKQGFTDIAPGTRCELLCPVSGQPLDVVGEVEDAAGAGPESGPGGSVTRGGAGPESGPGGSVTRGGARYYAIYLTPQLSRGSMVMISDVWGHYHSRIIDDFELISAWASDQ